MSKLSITVLSSEFDDENESGTAVISHSRIMTKEPSMYNVLMHNDDYSPMDFVIQVLETIFRKSKPDAHRIMLDVHNKGVGICGVYTHEVAETKVNQANSLARENKHPLKCSMEKE